MRTFFLIPTVLAAISFSSSPTRAEVTFDVAVDVTTLSEDVRAFRVNCFTCEGACGDGPQGGPTDKRVDAGFAAHIFAPGQAHTFKGTITVVAQTVRPGNATDYLCYMTLAGSGGASGSEWEYPLAASHQTWARPKAGTPLIATIRGKL